MHSGASSHAQAFPNVHTPCAQLTLQACHAMNSLHCNPIRLRQSLYCAALPPVLCHVATKVQVLYGTYGAGVHYSTSTPTWPLMQPASCTGVKGGGGHSCQVLCCTGVSIVSGSSSLLRPELPIQVVNDEHLTSPDKYTTPLCTTLLPPIPATLLFAGAPMHHCSHTVP
jgi:hypothetical protein